MRGFEGLRQDRLPFLSLCAFRIQHRASSAATTSSPPSRNGSNSKSNKPEKSIKIYVKTLIFSFFFQYYIRKAYVRFLWKLIFSAFTQYYMLNRERKALNRTKFSEPGHCALGKRTLPSSWTMSRWICSPAQGKESSTLEMAFSFKIDI